ncbi:MAG: hypothetical protein Q8Q55_02535 [Undibacterium sp.]|nr:hypothetical protein [Undibacterium sp.]
MKSIARTKSRNVDLDQVLARDCVEVEKAQKQKPLNAETRRKSKTEENSQIFYFFFASQRYQK